MGVTCCASWEAAHRLPAQELSMQSLVVDSDAQIGTGETWDTPFRPVDYKVEAILARSAEAGIDRSCVMAPRNQMYEAPNKQVARLCAKNPEKLIGLAVHSPQRETGHLRRMLVEEVKSMGLKGVRSDGHPTRELLDVVAELNIPVIYYPDRSAPTRVANSNASAPQQAPGLFQSYFMMATAYPSVKFIMPHLGSFGTAVWWAHVEAIDLVKRFPNVYVGTSGVISHKYLEMATRELSAERIIFGSSAPELDPRVEIFAVKLLKLPESSKALVLGGNMQRLLG